MDRGVLYVAFGDKARSLVEQSVASLRAITPGLEVAVVSDTPHPAADRSIIRSDADAGARTWKTQMYFLSPFAQTLFLDADTIVRSSPGAGFTLLGYVDIVLGQDVNRVFEYNKWPYLFPDEVRATKTELGTGHHMYFNDGVVFFNKHPRVEALMMRWIVEWQRWGKQDQMALIRAIGQCPVRIAAMRAPWNTHHSHQAEFVYHKHHAARREGAPR